MMIPIAGSVISDPPPHPGNTYAEGQHPKRSTSAKGAHSFVVVCMFPLPVVVMSNEPRHFLMMQVLQWLPVRGPVTFACFHATYGRVVSCQPERCG